MLHQQIQQWNVEKMQKDLMFLLQMLTILKRGKSGRLNQAEHWKKTEMKTIFLTKAPNVYNTEKDKDNFEVGIQHSVGIKPKIQKTNS